MESTSASALYISGESNESREWGCQRCVTAVESAEHDAQSAQHGQKVGYSGSNNRRYDMDMSVSAVFRVVEAHRERRR